MGAMGQGLGPGIIVVAEQPISDLLSSHNVSWFVQERQPAVAAMWASLSAGRLDPHSRVLVFSDSLHEGLPSDETERFETARAIVAMANAEAHVFVVVWRPAMIDALRRQIDLAASSQGLDANKLIYHFLPVVQGGRAVMDSMRRVLDGEIDFPEVYPLTINDPISREGKSVSSPSPALPMSLPDAMPASHNAATDSQLNMTAAPVVEPSTAQLPDTQVTPAPSSTHQPFAAAAIDAQDPHAPSARPMMPKIARPSSSAPAAPHPGLREFPDAACQTLLSRNKVPGQVTITVTSSKGGSGKSTCALLLAGAIARGASESGHPLRICLMDLDTRDGQVASLIGKFMPTALNIRVQPVWDEDTIRRHLVRDDRLGIDTLLAPIRPRTADTVGPEFYRTILRSLQRMYDVIILDTSVQYLDPLIAEVCLPEADEILFVTTLASTAVQGMARALREITAPIDESGMGIPREKIGIVVNQSVADVGMDRNQVLAAGLGVPVVGVIPLATKDVLTATNLNRMSVLLDHPMLGPAYSDLAQACLPQHVLAPWRGQAVPVGAGAAPMSVDEGVTDDRRRRLFRK